MAETFEWSQRFSYDFNQILNFLNYELIVIVLNIIQDLIICI